MNNLKKFKTKNGFCHILSDKIVLTRDGFVGNVSEVVVGNKISRILTIYGILSLALFYLAYKGYTNDKVGGALFFGVIGVFLVYGIFKSFKNSATPVIYRDKIQGIIFKPGFPGATRSRFEVFFKDDKGKIKKRLIMLPGSMNEGDNETEKALKVMIDENLIDS